MIEASKNEVIDVTKSLRSDIQSLKDTISSLVSRVTQLEKENKILKERQTSAFEPLSVESMCSDMMNELQQRERRRCNLIIAGVVEQTSGSVAEREYADEEICSEIFGSIGLPQSRIGDLRRIGKLTNERNRLIRITMVEEEDKRFLIKSSRKLRFVEKFKNVYEKPDLTLLQRKIDFELRRELQTTKAAHLEKDFVIHKGKVVEKNSSQGFRTNF